MKETRVRIARVRREPRRVQKVKVDACCCDGFTANIADGEGCFRRIVIESAKLELEIWAFSRLEEFVDRHCVEGKDGPIQFWYETTK